MGLRLPGHSIQRAGGRHRRVRETPRRPLVVLGITGVALLGLIGGASDIGGPASGGAQSRAAAGGASAVDIAAADRALKPYLEPAHLEAVPVGPGKVAEPVKAVLTGSRVMDALGESGIPDVAVRAYKQAEASLASSDASCRMRWTLLAAIGRVESNHGRFGGAQLREDGYGTEPIRGIPLDGRPKVALIRDTDKGALDGDRTYDRAVGPMQFIPSTWRAFAVDANGDGRRDPNNIFDAAQGAGVYLCTGNSSVGDPIQAARSVRRYNNSDEYVRVVLGLAARYEGGRVVELPSLPGSSGPEPSVPGPSVPGPSTADTSITAGGSPSAPPPAQPEAPAAPPPAKSEPAAEPAPAEPEPAPEREPAESEPAPEPAPAEPEPAPEHEPAESEAPEPAPTESEAPADPANAEPPSNAAVGWAPAMREVVVEILMEASTGDAPVDQ